VKALVKTGMEVVVKVHYVVRHSEPLRLAHPVHRDGGSNMVNS